MMRRLFIFLVTFLPVFAFAQKAETIKLPDLKKLIDSKSESIYVINFWATWCGPCVKELPLFEALTNEKKPGVEVYLVSMDLDLDPNPEKVYKFIERKKIISKVLLLDEKDPNSWIDQVSPEWSGALPATLIINKATGQRKFLEKELHPGDLEKVIAEISR